MEAKRVSALHNIARTAEHGFCTVVHGHMHYGVWSPHCRELPVEHVLGTAEHVLGTVETDLRTAKHCLRSAELDFCTVEHCLCTTELDLYTAEPDLQTAEHFSTLQSTELGLCTVEHCLCTVKYGLCTSVMLHCAETNLPAVQNCENCPPWLPYCCVPLLLPTLT